MIAEEYVAVLLLAILLLHNNEACDVRYCEVSQWSAWSGCFHRCGNGGTQSRTRYKTVVETCGGDCHYELSEYRNCPKTCVNGGTPSYSGCACQTGYTGSCCELGGGGKWNPSSQESDGTKCGTKCGLGIFGACCACGGIFLLIYGYKKDCKGATLIVNCVCCKEGPTNITNIVPTTKAEEKSTANDQHTPDHDPPDSPPCYSPSTSDYYDQLPGTPIYDAAKTFLGM